MRLRLAVALLASSLAAAPKASSAGDFLAGAWAGAEVVVAGDGQESASALSWGLLGQLRASPSLALELRAGPRRYDSTSGAGPSSTDFSHRQLPISVGVKALLSPRGASSFAFVAGLVLAPTETTKTEHFRPSPRPIEPRVTETTGLSLGGYLGIGGDVALGPRTVLILDARLVFQTAPAGGDSSVFVPVASCALAWRF